MKKSNNCFLAGCSIFVAIVLHQKKKKKLKKSIQNSELYLWSNRKCIQNSIGGEFHWQATCVITNKGCYVQMMARNLPSVQL